MVTSNWSREYLCWIPGNDRVMRESPIVLDGMKIRVANTTKQYLHCYIVVTILSTHMQHQNKDMLYTSSITTSKTWICLSLSLQMGEKKSNKPSREMKWRKNTRFVVSRPSKCFVLIGRFRHILFRLSVTLSLWAIDFLLFFFVWIKMLLGAYMVDT